MLHGVAWTEPPGHSCLVTREVLGGVWLHRQWHGSWQGRVKRTQTSDQIRFRSCLSTVWLWESHWPSLSLIHLSVKVYLCYRIATESYQETNFSLLKMLNKTHIGMKNIGSVVLYKLTEHTVWTVASEWQAGGCRQEFTGGQFLDGEGGHHTSPSVHHFCTCRSLIFICTQKFPGYQLIRLTRHWGMGQKLISWLPVGERPGFRAGDSHLACLP